MQRRDVLALVGGCSTLAGCTGEGGSTTSPSPTAESTRTEPASPDPVLHVERVFPEAVSNVTLGLLHRPTADAVAEAAATDRAELPTIYENEEPAVATADAIDVAGEWYDPEYVAGGGMQANYRLTFRPPAEIDEDPPGDDDDVIAFESLPAAQQAIAEEAIADEYYVDWEEKRSEAFEKVSGIEYLEYDGGVYARRLVHGDRIVPPELRLRPTTPEDAALQFVLERATLAGDAKEWAVRELGLRHPTAGAESFPVATVPDDVLTVARAYDYCSFATALYRFSIREE